ncbi:TPA: 3-carboxy-cis,cis-muconate cycloisomerase [Acinetobacter baumannii]|uniref:3-carboxy-cis,cis-muconate cycloisomerase n=1 Tax=Acinetobacter baumannii TaxID=470 RepID=UPI0002D03C90|nr:3-carboxy-cis,cis-muconate cycloisomerase [Acinetobacter baumannii]ENV30431.1 3-carboxy-cis,cis-muconate cycloisomerase [Acinetobacter baumannii NIPH 60]MCZ2936958.1 3-carboxy-cis,cis-muconate cycloisomerase [Acinetobacter baumannii]MCZ3067917.1 3-carboxy-cis,cis-muconate cycloisomerase [Acinetobacter baumannii]MCZ3086555.1 3-carboxy-cis,cis-muconate cycloisomerase [Acinetobacter baumannii]MCZ3182880.1 3-carboxy-cis,cis-muconate cycloisomerase [Acinetobacter baumannii]
MSQLYASLFYQKDVTDIFSDSSLVTYMIQVEVALAQAQAQVGVIPQKAANTIAQVAEHALDKFDFSALVVATGLAGNIAIPFVKQLTAIVKDIDEDASRYVHWGATSQDILDTACILQCCDALNIVEAQLQQCYSTALEQAKQYRHQVMIGRTWLQQALPITLGHKLARWASAFKRDLDRIQAMKSRVLTAQLGGAVGSLASLQDQGSLVVSAFAKQLNLTVPTSTWHGERDRIVEIASVLGMIVGNTGKMARDWSLMMQTEIAELFEPTAKGRGGSSTMPHKRNPVAAASVLAAANRVPALMSSIYQSMVQEHERSLGAWHAEWLAVPEIFQLCAGALSRTGEVLQGFEVNAKHMQQNLECTSGLIMAEAVMMALAPKIGRLNAHHLVEAACKTAVAQNQHLFDVVSQLDEVKGQFSQEEIRNIFKPENYLGNIQQQIDAVLKEAQGESK